MVQWLRFHTPNAGILGSIPGQGTRSHMPQLRGSHASAEDLAQPNKYILKKKNEEEAFLYQILHYKARVTEALLNLAWYF